MSVHKIGGAIPLHKAQTLKEQNDHMEKQFRRAAETYEKHFLGEMVKAMRNTVKHSRLTAPTMAEKIYKEKLDSEYVESWGNQGGIGLADIIYTQMKERFGNQRQVPKPHGPIPVDQNTTIRIDESKGQQMIPIVQPNKTPQAQMNFIMQPDPLKNQNEVTSPWDGTVSQHFRSDEDRHTIKIDHEDDRTSTISYRGSMQAFRPGDKVSAGQRLGQILPGSNALTWDLVQKA